MSNIFIGIDPSVNSTGMTILNDDGYCRFFIIKGGKLSKKEINASKEYSDIFEYVDIVNGTIVSIGTHPCGMVVSPIPLDENMGLCSLSTTNKPVSMINMKEIDGLNFVKLDILGLDNIEIIK